LDWRHPGGPSIDLAVIRHLASRPGQRIGSLFLNPGGPGDSGVAAVAGRGEALDAMTDGRFDVVGWDPRGSGGSAPVGCFADPSERASFWNGLPVPTTRAEERRYLAKTIAPAQRCGARNGRLLAHISTADTDRTFEQLLALCQAAGPARQHARAWPHVVHRLQAISRIGAAPQGWAVGPSRASWPARPADRHTGPWTASTRNPVLLVGTRFDPDTPLVNARIAQHAGRSAPPTVSRSTPTSA
jgi:hypothetical protein